jgi:hypothetical protein
MAREKSKGSILLEIIAVILVVCLIVTILYPKKVWDEEDQNTADCRTNMDRILKAELVYQKFHNTYTDSLPGLVSFIKDDSTKEAIVDYFYADTALAVDLVGHITETDSDAAKIIDNLNADTLFYAIIETINYDSNLARVILERFENTDFADTVLTKKASDSSDVFILKELSKEFSSFDLYEPIKDDDSLYLVFERMMPEIPIGSLVDTLYALNEKWAQIVDSAVSNTLENMIICPTVGREYLVTVIDTSVIKYVNIGCPLDSTDIEVIKNDFVKYNFGHLRLKHHGKITETGEKSWL